MTVRSGLREAARGLCVLLLALCLAAPTAAQETGVTLGGALPGPLPLFPSDNWWNTDISQAPVDPASGALIGWIQASGRRRLHPDMGGDSGESPPDAIIYGMPYVVVPGTQPLEPVTFDYDDESDHGAPGRPPGYPIPEEARTEPRWIEGGLPGGGDAGDRHMLIVDRDNRLLYELYALRWNTALSRWEAGSGAIFPLDSNLRRPDGWTSADAAGLAILPGLIRYDEVFGADPIEHAFRVTVRATNGYVYPASHRAGLNPAAPPMGTRFRLKAGKDIAGYPAHIRKIFQAMKTYGLIVADNGSDMYITGTHDTRWDMGPVLQAFRSLYADDFEVIELGWQADPDDTEMDTDGDGLPDAWEARFGTDPGSAAGPDGASGDPDGDGLSNEDEHDAGSHPRGFVTRYLAEGATGSFFRTRIALLNPEAEVARVLLRFQRADGVTVTRALTLNGSTRATVDPATVTGLTVAEFSTVIESDGLVIVDRTMSWDGRGFGSHSETSIAEPASVWYLAEGATHSGFDLFYLVQNPNPFEVTVEVEYLLPAPATAIARTYGLVANSRSTIWVNHEHAALRATDVSAVLRTVGGADILVERAMYRTAGGRAFGAGHASAGVRQAGAHWFFAEGATGPFFDLYLLLANPAETSADVRVEYLLQGGEPIVKTYAVAPRSRYTVFVDGEDAALADAAVSMLVTATNGVDMIAERAMWWPGGVTTWHEAHNSPGAASAGTRWALAEGESGGPAGTSTYLLLANAAATSGDVAVRLIFEDGSSVERLFEVAGSSRFNVSVGDEFPEAAGRRFGALVESRGPAPAPVPLVVERAMYSAAEGVVWAAGTVALGTRLPP